MTARPGILLIGGYQLQGGEVPFDAKMDGIGQTHLRHLKDKKLMLTVPYNQDGTPSTAFKPWYHGNGGPQYSAVAASATTVTVSGTPFTIDELIGLRIILLNESPVPNVGLRAISTITDNTANVITFNNVGFTPGSTVRFMIGSGQFESYHPAQGWLHTSEIGTPSYRGGSAWNAFGQGVGPDMTLIHGLYEDVHNEAPWFFMAKYAVSNTEVFTDLGDAPLNGGRAALLNEITKIEAAAADDGDTVDWTDVIIDFSTEDAKIAASGGNPALFFANYKNNLTQLIAWLRTELGNANLRVCLVSHDPALYATTAPAAIAITRVWHAEIARDDENVGVIDMRGQPFGDVNNDPPTVFDAPSAEVTQYSTEGYMWYGREALRVIKRLTAGTPAAVAGAEPVYVLFGDSLTTGGIALTWVQESDSEELSGPNSGTNVERPSSQKIWNGIVAQLQTYDPSVNANTLQSAITSTSGPELSIMAELGARHPEGFTLLKIGSSGSGLASSLGAYVDFGTSDPAANGGPGTGGVWLESENQNYTILQLEMAKLVAYVNDVLGKQADMRGMMVILGTNDNGPTGGGAAFAAAIESFVLGLWSEFATRTSGADFPIAWLRPQPDFQGAKEAEISQIRAAIDLMADSYSSFKSVNSDNLERNREDNLHHTPDTSVEVGRRLVKAITSVRY